MAFTEEQKKEHIAEIQRLLGQIQLRSGELMTVFPNGVFGDRTRAAVRDFQQNNKLPVTGEIDSDTWNAITSVYIDLSRDIPNLYRFFRYREQRWQRGDDGLAAWVIQSMFKKLGGACDNVPDVEVTGKYMEDTEEAVRFFRKKCGLPDAAYVDRDTWKMLAECCKHFE